MHQDITIRQELPADYHAVEAIVREAFWDWDKKPFPCDEHYLLHKMREETAFIPELSLVAELPGGTIVGQIAYMHSHIVRQDDTLLNTLIFGPISVLPAYQKQGIGAALFRQSCTIAAALGHKAILIYGHPTYYPRLGFQEAAVFGITTHDGRNYPAFMAYELVPNALQGQVGRYIYNPIYDNLPPADVIAYDACFPAKQPAEA